MNTYNFTIARFVRDTIRNEPINIGVVITDNTLNESFGKFVELETVRKKIGGFNTKMIEHIISKLKGKNTVEIELEKLSGISNRLQFTTRRATKDQSIHDAANNIFKQYISIVEQKNIDTPRQNEKNLVDIIRKKINSTFKPELIRTNYKINVNMYTLSANIAIVTNNRKNLIHGFAYKEKEKIMKESWYKARYLEEVKNNNKNIFASMIVDSPKNDDEIFECFNLAKEELEKASWNIVELTDMNSHIEKIKKLYVSA